MGKKKATKCVHFTGVQNETCEAGVRYRDVAGGRSHLAVLPCLPPMPHKAHETPATCASKRLPTEAEIAASEAEFEQAMERLRRGVSSCCEAEIDESQVITSGRHKGHGPRYCTACRKLVFMV